MSSSSLSSYHSALCSDGTETFKDCLEFLDEEGSPGLAAPARWAPAGAPGAPPPPGPLARPQRAQLSSAAKNSPAPGQGGRMGPLGGDRQPVPAAAAAGEPAVPRQPGAMLAGAPSDSDEVDGEVQALTARAFRSLSGLPGARLDMCSSHTSSSLSNSLSEDGGRPRRWPAGSGEPWGAGTALHGRVGWPFPAGVDGELLGKEQFECVDVELENGEARKGHGKKRTVPKRQILLKRKERKETGFGPRGDGPAPQPPQFMKALNQRMKYQEVLEGRWLPAAAEEHTSERICYQRARALFEAQPGVGKVLDVAPRFARAPRPWPSLKERAIGPIHSQSLSFKAESRALPAAPPRRPFASSRAQEARPLPQSPPEKPPAAPRRPPSPGTAPAPRGSPPAAPHKPQEKGKGRVPQPRDVRKLVKSSYSLKFGTAAASRGTVAPASSGEPPPAAPLVIHCTSVRREPPPEPPPHSSPINITRVQATRRGAAPAEEPPASPPRRERSELRLPPRAPAAERVPHVETHLHVLVGRPGRESSPAQSSAVLRAEKTVLLPPPAPSPAEGKEVRGRGGSGALPAAEGPESLGQRPRSGDSREPRAGAPGGSSARPRPAEPGAGEQRQQQQLGDRRLSVGSGGSAGGTGPAAPLRAGDSGEGSPGRLPEHREAWEHSPLWPAATEPYPPAASAENSNYLAIPERAPKPTLMPKLSSVPNPGSSSFGTPIVPIPASASFGAPSAPNPASASFGTSMVPNVTSSSFGFPSASSLASTSFGTPLVSNANKSFGAPLPTLPRPPEGSAAVEPPAQPHLEDAPPFLRRSDGPSPSGRSRQSPPKPFPAAVPAQRRMLVDPSSGKCYYMEPPRQPQMKTLYDPETGQYLEVLVPPVASHAGLYQAPFNPLVMAPGVYGSPYAPYGGFPGLPAPAPSAPSPPHPSLPGGTRSGTPPAQPLPAATPGSDGPPPPDAGVRCPRLGAARQSRGVCSPPRGFVARPGGL
uniref:Uncharacterized protein n=1 Tax=Geospiza parvula TaxID=87175 RepID=A0A8U8AKB8_GEOPR